MNIKKINKQLSQFDGGHARIVRYSDGMEMLRIEVTRERRKCAVINHGCRHISVPTVWTDCRLRVVPIGDEVVELRDEQNGLTVRCWSVSYETSEVDTD